MMFGEVILEALFRRVIVFVFMLGRVCVGGKFSLSQARSSNSDHNQTDMGSLSWRKFKAFRFLTAEPVKDTMEKFSFFKFKTGSASLLIHKDFSHRFESPFLFNFVLTFVFHITSSSKLSFSSWAILSLRTTLVPSSVGSMRSRPLADTHVYFFKFEKQ